MTTLDIRETIARDLEIKETIRRQYKRIRIEVGIITSLGLIGWGLYLAGKLGFI